jgi:N-acetylneuraminic acid mutarotase
MIAVKQKNQTSVGKNINALCLFTFILIFNMSAETPKLKWNKSTALPEPRSGYASGVIDGQLIIAGGTYWEGTKDNWTQKLFTPVVHAFDPATKRWQKLPDAPIPFGYAASIVISNRLFVLGGFTGQEINTEIYTLEKTSGKYAWKRFAPMPANRLFAGIVAVGSSIYLLGGTERFEPYDKSGTCCTSRSAVGTLLMLDTAAREPRWRNLTAFPGSQRWLFALETDGESLWMFGGAYQEKQADPITRIPEVWRYSLAKDRWEQVGTVPAAAIESSPLVPIRVGNSILLVSYKKTVWAFDCSTHAWSESTPLPEEAFVDKFSWANGVVVGAGGENRLDGPRRRSDWTFIGRVEGNGSK